MYIGAGNPPRSIQAQTGRWVNQNMSLNIISLIEPPLTELSNRASELPIEAGGSSAHNILHRIVLVSPLPPIEQQLEFCRQNGNQRLSALWGSHDEVSAFFYALEIGKRGREIFTNLKYDDVRYPYLYIGESPPHFAHAKVIFKPMQNHIKLFKYIFTISKFMTSCKLL